MRTSLLAATPLASALAWSAALISDGTPLEPVPALLVGIGMILSATVSTIGMVLTGGRWSRSLGLMVLLVTAVVAVIRPFDGWWVIGVTLSAVSLTALLSPALSRTIRKLPSASGPPPRAVAAPLVLLMAPCVMGLLGNDAAPWALLTVGLTAPLTAFVYSRVLPGGLLAIRIGWPLLALTLTPWLGLACGATSAILGLVVAVLSWDGSVKASYHPPREVGTTYVIPPELTPKEILDAAEIDESGRPL